MTQPRSNRPESPKAPLNTRTLLTCVAIGIGCSLVVVPVNYLAAGGVGAFPPALIATCGVQILAAIVALRLLRHGGVGILASAVVGLIGVFTSPQGWGTLSIIGFGVLVEIPFLIGRYRRWGAGRYVVAAIIAGLFYCVTVFMFFDVRSMVVWVRVVSFILPPVSMLVFTWLGVLAADGLRRAGVGPKTRVRADDAV